MTTLTVSSVNSIQAALDQGAKVINVLPGRYYTPESIKVNTYGTVIRGQPDEFGELPVLHSLSTIPKSIMTLLNLETSTIVKKDQIVYTIPFASLPIGIFQPRGFFGFGTGNAPSDIDIYYGDLKLTRPRWPRSDKLTIKQIIHPGDAATDYGGILLVNQDVPIERWSPQTMSNIWSEGVKSKEWAWFVNKIKSINSQKAIELSKYEKYALEINEASGFFIDNVFDELEEYQYYVDFKNQLLYISLPQLNNTVSFVYNKANVITVAANNVTIENIKFEKFRGSGITVTGNNTIIRNCVMEDVNRGAINMNGDNGIVESCVLKRLGESGILVSGTRNRVTNCDISKFGRIHKCYTCGIQLTGPFNRADRNTIYDFPHPGIVLRGSECVIEQNMFYDGMKEFMDLGIIYTNGAATPMVPRGSVIRNNLFHNIINSQKKVFGIYLDDFSSSVHAHNNIFFRFFNKTETDEDYAACFVHAGNSNKITDSIFINTPFPYRMRKSQNTSLLANQVRLYNELIPTLSLADRQKFNLDFSVPVSTTYVSGYNNVFQNNITFSAPLIPSPTEPLTDIRIESGSKFQIVSKQLSFQDYLCSLGETTIGAYLKPELLEYTDHPWINFMNFQDYVYVDIKHNKTTDFLINCFVDNVFKGMLKVPPNHGPFPIYVGDGKQIGFDQVTDGFAVKSFMYRGKNYIRLGQQNLKLIGGHVPFVKLNADRTIVGPAGTTPEEMAANQTRIDSMYNGTFSWNSTTWTIVFA